MGRPTRKHTKNQGEVGLEKLTYAQAICFLVGTLFFLVGSSLAVYVATKDLKKAEQPPVERPLI